MKKIILLAIVAFFSVSVNAQEINWITIEEAVELQKKEPRKIIIDMYTVWCPPCKMLDKHTFQNKDVADYVNKNYYAVKFNAQGNDVVNFKDKEFTNPNYNPAKAKGKNSQHQFANAFGIRSYPSVVFLDEDLNLLTTIIGFKKPKEFELFLKLFKENHHKDIKSQKDFEAYYKAFKPQFKG